MYCESMSYFSFYVALISRLQNIIIRENKGDYQKILRFVFDMLVIKWRQQGVTYGLKTCFKYSTQVFSLKCITLKIKEKQRKCFKL